MVPVAKEKVKMRIFFLLSRFPDPALTDWSGFQSKIIQRTVSSFLSLKVANGTNDVSLVMAGNSVE